MSEALFTNLPVFHPATGKSLAELQGMAAPENAEADIEICEVVPSHVQSEVQPENPGSLDVVEEVEENLPDREQNTSELQDLFGLLCKAMKQFERTAPSQMAVAAQAIARELFPKLSDDFLAEEISRHLPDLVHLSAPQLEIHADPDLVATLEKILSSNPEFSQRFHIKTRYDAPAKSVDISWVSGGLTFDFERMLGACLSRLNTTQVDKWGHIDGES